jgi:SAM-dependent methyltransferase
MKTREEVDGLYAESAADYNALWAPVLAPLTDPLLDALPLACARRVLDVGAGTGNTYAQIARRASGARVVGVDRVAAMVGRSPAAMLPAVMDAATLAFRSGSFDVAFSAFVLFFVPDPIVALREMARVVVPGGAVGLASWGDEPVFPAARVWSEELSASGVPATPQLRHDRLDTAEKVHAALMSAGLIPQDVWTQRHEIRTEPGQYLSRMLAFGGRRRLAALSTRDRAECVARIRRRLADLSPDDFCDRSEVVYGLSATPSAASSRTRSSKGAAPSRSAIAAASARSASRPRSSRAHAR